jgi:hypothetical protein
MGRPATGKTKVMGFRPPKPLRDEFERLARTEDRTPSDALVEAMHDWIKKKRREHGDSTGDRDPCEESDNTPK